MPMVILPADDVSNAAEAALEDLEKVRHGQTRKVQMAADIRVAATWLENIGRPDGAIGLTLEEAKLLEGFLPVYE